MLISFLNYDFVNSLYPFELEVFAFNLSNSSQIYLQIHYLFSQLNLFSLEFLGLYFIKLFVFFFPNSCGSSFMFEVHFINYKSELP